MFSSVGALAVYVTEKERAKEFYRRVLGFEVVADLGPSLCFLKSPNGQIDIYLEGGMKPADTDASTARLSFFLRAEAPAAVVFSTFQQAGVRLLQDAPQSVDEDTACFQLLDPDGNIILYEWDWDGARARTGFIVYLYNKCVKILNRVAYFSFTVTLLRIILFARV